MRHHTYEFNIDTMNLIAIIYKLHNIHSPLITGPLSTVSENSALKFSIDNRKTLS